MLCDTSLRTQAGPRARDNNVMHAKPDLRVFEMDDRWFRLGDHGRYPAKQHVEVQYQNPVVVDRRYRNRLVHLSNDLPSSYFRAPKQLRDTKIGHQI